MLSEFFPSPADSCFPSLAVRSFPCRLHTRVSRPSPRTVSRILSSPLHTIHASVHASSHALSVHSIHAQSASISIIFKFTRKSCVQSAHVPSYLAIAHKHSVFLRTSAAHASRTLQCLFTFIRNQRPFKFNAHAKFSGSRIPYTSMSIHIHTRPLKFSAHAPSYALSFHSCSYTLSICPTCPHRFVFTRV